MLVVIFYALLKWVKKTITLQLVLLLMVTKKRTYAGDTGVHNGNYTVKLEQDKRLFFEIDSFGSYSEYTFFLDLSVTYDNGIATGLPSTANNVSSPIIGNALFSLLAAFFFMRKRQA